MEAVVQSVPCSIRRPDSNSMTAGAEGGSWVIDVDQLQEWVKSLNCMVEASSPLKQPRRIEPCTICRVPAILQGAHPGAYRPKVVSIGPYHHNDPQLAMEHLKLHYLGKILHLNSSAKLEEFLKKIKGLEDRARSSYAQDSQLSKLTSNEFVEMMLLDGCFIIALLLMKFDCDNNKGVKLMMKDKDDPVLQTRWMKPLIMNDMLKLENQIPFFVLESLFALATATSDQDGDQNDPPFSLVELILDFFNELLPGKVIEAPWDQNKSVPRFHHLLHFFHAFVFPNKTNCSSPPTPESVPCATKLKEAGVKFRRKSGYKSFLDVTFKHGTMEIPPLQLCDNTNPLFCNLIAFEQCFCVVGTHVTAYVMLIDCIINEAEDVALLHQTGCVLNGLGSDENAAAIVNELGKEVTVDYDTFYLAALFQDVKQHCDLKCNKWRATLVRKYFSNPWATISLAGALFVIFLTVVQTVFAVLAYFLPRN